MAAPWRFSYPLLPVSTRANIILTDGTDELIFYRHFDDYPEGTLPTLTQFLDLVDHGTIRDNVGQAADWLILIGAQRVWRRARPERD